MKTRIILMVLAAFLLGLFGCGSEEDILPASTAKVVTDKNLSNKVPAPVLDALPADSFSSEQYTGDIRWYTAEGNRLSGAEKFSDSKVYRADVVLTSVSGWTLDGVAKNFFKHSGALKTANPINPGRCEIVFSPLRKADGTLNIPDNPNLKEEFLANSTEEFFESLHTYINEEDTNLEKDGLVKVGDYIDLPSLIVDMYNYVGGFTLSSATDTYTHKMLRLIVVGINTYNGKNIPSSPVEGVKNNNSPHVVFQFQNIPVRRRNSDPDTNIGGYLASEMRQYLISGTDVDGTTARRSFLSALNTAGVKSEYMMEATRKLSNSGIDTLENPAALDTITDKLFIASEWEMFGECDGATDIEADSEQAHFSYYPKPEDSEDTVDQIRIKYHKETATMYWTSTPYFIEEEDAESDDGYGCLYIGVRTDGGSIALGTAHGLAPAFGIW